MECPNCGSSNCENRYIQESICLDCKTVWNSFDRTVILWGTPPEDEDDDIVFVCPNCGDEINIEDYCDSCGWHEDEDYDPYSYIGWDGHEY